MARIKIELEDTVDGGMIFNLESDDLATLETHKTNTCVQNLAILLIELLKDSGVGKGRLPNLTNEPNN